MELELKQIVGYLPYGLKGLVDYKKNGSPYSLELQGILPDCLRIQDIFDGYYYCQYNEFKPILRPISDLTKEIEVNGEKFVPIIELAKLTHVKEKHIAEISQSVKGECDGVKYSFGFYNGSFWMKRLRGKKWVVNDVFSQDELFEKLDEWHFDWKYNLIKNGIAIDKNTL